MSRATSPKGFIKRVPVPLIYIKLAFYSIKIKTICLIKMEVGEEGYILIFRLLNSILLFIILEFYCAFFPSRI